MGLCRLLNSHVLKLDTGIPTSGLSLQSEHAYRTSFSKGLMQMSNSHAPNCRCGFQIWISEVRSIYTWGPSSAWQRDINP